MDRTPLLLMAAVCGFIAMVAGFAGYVMEPNTAAVVIFVVGLFLLVVAYALLSVANRRTSAEYNVLAEEESSEGYVYYMFGEPDDNGATITDLRER